MRTYFLLIFSFSVVLLNAQIARKPSANYTTEKTDVKTSTSYLSEIKEYKDFYQLARIYNKGTLHEIPHILFAIDRNKKDEVYYINTPLYEFHLHFLNEILNRNYTPEDLKSYYKDESRRFILGTISYQSLIKQFTYEFWEGDKLTSGILASAQQAITNSFSATIVLKTNATQHEDAARKASVKYVTQEQIIKEYPYIPLNTGTTKGRIRIADNIEELTNISENDILILKEVPISIPTVSGVITERASTLLSHVNVLARAMKIPSLYLKDASQKLKPYEGKYVELKATNSGYTIHETAEVARKSTKKTRYSVKSDIRQSKLIPLSEMREKDYIYCGAKAANLGEIKAKMKNIIIPDGFSIPFAQYHTFMKQYGFYNQIREMEKKPEFQSNVDIRKAELEKLRAKIENTVLDKTTSQLWVEQWKSQLHGKGVFVRSSSNAEDLKNFSGAGLFTTVPNVKTVSGLEEAVKKVWASVYNFEAYESRRYANIPDSLVMMSVLIQHAADSEISGVMITKDPYDAQRWDLIYIAAKRGIGIKVVEGKRIAEQVMYSEKTKAVQIISYSEENTELRLAPEGGVNEIPLTEKTRVMSDELIAKLAVQGRKIKQLFKGDMDIEWAVADDKVIILQARPYK
ncbi:PEP/pyruvate-binding domain-containing protein [Bacteroides sp. 519]|uniref:PEP/pyruvate-binding domain-containing protein n=1 Tax=Bacteroides sp. 519 TaxID=2302937 RepID=UPI0019402B22|nr:PEP/pyruvate-binding domain-containing protein [Bacteroides sp. 519]NDV60642.1 pyruvate, phosphate dikinase [Bacteroides sp. 519]